VIDDVDDDELLAATTVRIRMLRLPHAAAACGTIEAGRCLSGGASGEVLDWREATTMMLPLLSPILLPPFLTPRVRADDDIIIVLVAPRARACSLCRPRFFVSLERDDAAAARSSERVRANQPDVKRDTFSPLFFGKKKKRFESKERGRKKKTWPSALDPFCSSHFFFLFHRLRFFLSPLARIAREIKKSVIIQEITQ